MSEMTDTMKKANPGATGTIDPGVGTPKAGDRFRCQKCGMEVQVTADCGCKGDVHFHCCGQELQKM